MKRMIWQFSWFACLVLSLVAAARLARAQIPVAADPPRQGVPEALEKLFRDIDEESLKEAPKRDYKIEKGAAQQVKLFKADSELLKNKFVASARLMIPRDRLGNVDLRVVSKMEEQLMLEVPDIAPRLLGRNGLSLLSLFTGTGRNPFRGLAKSTHGEYFRLLVPLCPKDQLPSEATVSFLTSAECDRDLTWDLDGSQGGLDWIVKVYAPTQEAAEQRIAAIVRLLDNGLCRSLQKDCLAEARKSLDTARKGYEELARQGEAIRAEEAKAAKPTEITPEILRELKAQKVMVAVELAGLNARVKACNEMLKEVRDDTRPPSAVQTSISDMKVRAEVELAGTKEKLDRINAFIKEANDSYALQNHIRGMMHAQEKLGLQIQLDERRAESYARLVSLYAPLELKDNQITISPVEWTN